MLDGRIDTQGPVRELRAQGVLDDITQDEAIEVHKEEQAVAEAEAAAEPADVIDVEEGTTTKVKKPRKLIEEEKRETGSVKWHIYKAYLKASYVCFVWNPHRNVLIPVKIVLDLGHSIWAYCPQPVLGCRGEGLDQGKTNDD